MLPPFCRRAHFSGRLVLLVLLVGQLVVTRVHGAATSRTWPSAPSPETLVKGRTADLKLDYEDAVAEESLLSDYILWSSVVSSVHNWKLRRRAARGTASTTSSGGGRGVIKKRGAHHRSRRDEEVVCYRDVGCFRDEGPFDYLDTLPQSPEQLDTSFTLYTKANIPTGYTVSTAPKPSPLPDTAPPTTYPGQPPPPPLSSEAHDGPPGALPAPPSTLSGGATVGGTLNSTSRSDSDQGHLSPIWPAFKDRSTFNASSPIKVIIHGFGSSGKRLWVMQMTEALIQAEPSVNVLVVDWAKGAVLPNYVQAAANTRLVGMQLALFIRSIASAYSVPINATAAKIHLIGFSLGAHIAGFTGSELNSSLARITGLDPAAPLFEGYPEPVRLDSGDAQFVDVIHTNGDGFLRGGLGSFQAMGHVDFYPNGGRVQVGCNSVFIGAISDLLSYSKSWSQSLCHHRRSFKYFVDSMSGCQYKAFKCSQGYDEFLKGNCFEEPLVMGYKLDNYKARGKYYLATREKQPFCASQYKVRVESSEGQGQTWGTLELSIRNETFALNDDELRDSDAIQGLVVATSPSQDESTSLAHSVGIKYVKYKGWIFSGKKDWSLDKVTLTDQDGTSRVACDPVPLEDSVQSLVRMADGAECAAWPQSLFYSLNQKTFIRSKPVALISSLFAGVGGPAKVGPQAPPLAPHKEANSNEMSNQINNEIASERKLVH